MIYLISDIHGNKNFKGLQDYLKIATENDLLIILGDIGLNFAEPGSDPDFTEYFLSLKKNIAFIDGNHENFPYLAEFPEESWNGGKVRRITENIVYLQRGNIYNIDGKTFFTFGGCRSGVKWAQMGLWHYEETASYAQCTLAYENLQNADLSVDYILTHKYEVDDTVPTMDRNLYDLTAYIEKNVTYRHWYYGHNHFYRPRNENHTCIYDELVSLI